MTESLAWLTPSPLWQQDTTGVDEPAFERPWIAEFQSDRFVPDFLDLLNATKGKGPAALSENVPMSGHGTSTDPYVLFQPIHGCFYLVVGSLVCRRIGLPDREVVPKGQRASFVVRRLTAAGAEQAWVAKGTGGAWVTAMSPRELVDNEEQLALHQAALGAPVGSDTTAHLLGLDEPGRRAVHYGYIPAAKRTAKAEALPDPVEALKGAVGKADGDDPRLMEFRIRIAGPWSNILNRPPGTDAKVGSLYFLLDLRDWLHRYLPSVLAELLAPPTVPSLPPDAEHLRAALDVDIRNGSNTIALGAALSQVGAFAPLVTGDPTNAFGTNYDVGPPVPAPPVPPRTLTQAKIDALAGIGPGDGGLVFKALAAAASNATAAVVPDELAHSVVPRPTNTSAAAKPDVHVLRMVYEHEPCAPVLSAPSPVLRFAGVYDPDAPARSVRIEMPDPAHLRNFKRGVGIEMSPTLRKILDSVHPGILKGEKPNTGGSEWGLGMICSFSIQIIFLVAFIVMFIFLILLNIVFWWLAFLKICLPIPRKK